MTRFLARLLRGGTEAGAYRASPRRPLSRAWREGLAGYMMASPWLFGFFAFTAGPIVLSLYYSFTFYQITTPPNWIGLTNYRILFYDDPKFRTSLYNTVYYAVFVVPLTVVNGLTVATLLNQPIPGRSVFRTIYYLPSVVSGVANAMLWLWVLNPKHGLANVILSWFGLKGLPWLNSATWAKPALILMSLWGVGGTMVIYLAGLQGVPQHLYEAAEIDGANAWQRYWKVTIPLLTPTIFFNMVTSTIGTFQVFTQAYVWTTGTGTGAGPHDSLLFYVLYMYRRTFGELRMGYGSAMAWILFTIVLILTLIQFRFGQRWVYYEASAGKGI
ncbi:MAG: sugar ABC transporter permease [Chloroflexi bacterium]|nr:sugar ABC transporter permease [Chloroflexota bacterium]